MKKILSVLLISILVFSLFSCTVTNSEADKLRIVTTIFPQYDFARAVSAAVPEAVELTMLLPPGSESHHYEPSLADLALIEGCDLFICIGGETDAWVEDAINAVGSSINVLRLIDLVPLLPESEDGILEHDDHHDHAEDEHCSDHHEGFDEHVWTSPVNAAVLTHAICDAMAGLRPDLAEQFKGSAEAYIAKLLDLDRRFTELAEAGKNKTLYFADRFPFRYFTDRYGFDHLAAFSGCSSDSEPTLSTIYSLTESFKDANAKVIFVGEFSSKNAAEVIAEECTAEIQCLHSCHNVSKEDLEGGVTYVDLMEKNLYALTKALS